MVASKFLALLVGPIVAGVVSAAKIRFTSWGMNRSRHPQLKEVTMGMIKNLINSLVGLNPAGSWSAIKMLSVLLTFILGVFVLSMGPAAAAEKKMVTDPTTGEMVTAPQYGGRLTIAKKPEPPHTDSWFTHGAGAAHSAVVEKLADGNWGIDRNEHDFKSNFVPLFAMKGHLAENWEQPDPLTIVFHIRQGVHWHDKAPMNGRALTAEDVEFNFHRLTGLGSGFTEPSPYTADITAVPFESITATDKNTVVFKLKRPSPTALLTILDSPYVFIQPPEVIKQHGDVKDWRNLVGTGPFMLTEWVEGSSMTWVKNPDYWGTDEKFPQNRLPYVDELKALILPEDATRLAALRSGKLDYIGHLGVSQIFTIDEAESLKKTNPELVLTAFAFRSETSFAAGVRPDNSPINDLRVRQAMQMALDLETIANTYFRGWAEWKPMGVNGTGLKGYAIPFDEWPAEVKKGYMYNPEGAEKLLDEAGYPRGADGIRFKTVLNHLDRWDLAYRELVASYWGKIGIDIEIREMDGSNYGAIIRERVYEGVIDSNPGYEWNPLGQIAWFKSDSGWNPPNIQDPVYDAMVEAAQAATTIEEQQGLIIEADMYVIKNHWYIWGGRAPQFNVNQPWLIGYNGEMQMGNMDFNGVFARLWIDQDLKKEMGF